MSSAKEGAGTPFGPGFERDGRILLLALSEKAISRAEFRRNFARMGVELDPEPGPNLTLQTPALQMPSLQQEPELYLIPDDPDHMFDPVTGYVYRVADGALVGQLDLPEDGDEPIDVEPEPEPVPAEIAAASEQVDDAGE